MDIVNRDNVCIWPTALPASDQVIIGKWKTIAFDFNVKIVKWLYLNGNAKWNRKTIEYCSSVKVFRCFQNALLSQCSETCWSESSVGVHLAVYFVGIEWGNERIENNGLFYTPLFFVSLLTSVITNSKTHKLSCYWLLTMHLVYLFIYFLFHKIVQWRLCKT